MVRYFLGSQKKEASMFWHLMFLLSFFYTNYEIADEPEPYQSIVALPTNLNGFFGAGIAQELQRIMNIVHPKVIVELGSWVGSSAVYLAQNSAPDTLVYAVDHWLGSAEHHVQAPFNAMLPTLYQQFLSNVKNVGLTHKIIPVRMTTLEAARSLNIQPDMIYIDASHDEESVYQDIMAWYPKLQSNGIMCGDDFNWPGVARAVNRAATELHRNIHASGPTWSFNPKA
jgi:hypothetical protein